MQSASLGICSGVGWRMARERDGRSGASGMSTCLKTASTIRLDAGGQIANNTGKQLVWAVCSIYG